MRDRYPMYYKGHPRLYFKSMPIFWWTKKWSHVRFIIRELTSFGVAFFAIIIVLNVHALKQGPESYNNFQLWLQSPIAIILHSIAFVLVVYHSITWFNLAPKAMVIKLGKNRVPGYIISGMNYVAWVAVSILILWLILK
jgi:fumarate reductase subunit C